VRRALFAFLALAMSAAPAAEKDKSGAKGGIDAKTGEAIDAAIAKGRAWLRAEAQKEVATPAGTSITHKGPDGKDQTYSFPVGRPALLGLALLEAGLPPADPLLKQIWDKLKSKSPPPTTYDAGVGLLFAEAYLRASNGGRRVTSLDSKDRDWMQKAADYLASGCYGGGWTYVCPGGAGYPLGEDPKKKYSIGDQGGGGEGEDPGAANAELERLVSESAARNATRDHDHSNSQYAVLGLKAASLCGVKVKNARLMWRTVVYHFLKGQEKDGPEVDLKLTREESRFKAEDYTMEMEPQKPRARGWAYGDGGEAYGSMSAAGMTALIVAQSEVTDLSGDEKHQILMAVRDSLAWFQQNWAMDKNPLSERSGGGMAPAAHYYHLYGVERVGMLTLVRALAGHSWYKEGADLLLRAQKQDGRWPSASQGFPEDDRIKTAYALLFLARSTKSEYAIGEK